MSTELTIFCTNAVPFNLQNYPEKLSPFSRREDQASYRLSGLRASQEQIQLLGVRVLDSVDYCFHSLLVPSPFIRRDYPQHLPSPPQLPRQTHLCLVPSSAKSSISKDKHSLPGSVWGRAQGCAEPSRAFTVISIPSSSYQLFFLLCLFTLGPWYFRFWRILVGFRTAFIF